MELSTRLNAGESLGGRILKVNHAGETGAVCIYAGQIVMARITAPRLVAQLQEFKSHEERHRAIFLAELQRRGLPRCRSHGLCALGGWVLGLLTGLLGARAIAATTVAVEHVVLQHLQQQLQTLAGRDEAAVAAITQIVAEEQQHHDHAVRHLGGGGWWTRWLTPVVAASTEAVIWLGMHL
jgi:ubiquinone biosynthesis monooxygenase Coq7